MTQQVDSGSVKKQQRKRLAALNNKLLPKLQAREQLAKLLPHADAKINNLIELRRHNLRNEVVEMVIATVPDFLEAIAHTWNNYFSQDEAVSIVYEHLLTSVDKYNSKKKPFCKFTSFFWMYNKNLFRNKVKALRAAKRDVRQTVSLDATIASWESDEEIGKYDTLIVNSVSYDTYFHSSAIRSLYRGATEKQQFILRKIYLGYSQTSIAKELKVTGTNINAVIRGLRKELSRLLYD